MIMAALSRPSLRSSTRKIAEPGLLATGKTNGPVSQGKRTRDVSPGSDSNGSSKRLKNSPKERILKQHSKSASKSLPIRDSKPPPSTKAVTSRTTSCSAANGTSPTTISHHRLAKTQIGVGARDRDSVNVKPAATNEKRSLRSHDGGSRSKTELELYFPNYDDLISIDPKTSDGLTAETKLYVVDEPPKSFIGTSSIHKKPRSLKSKSAKISGSPQTIVWPEEAFTNLTDAVRIDLLVIPCKDDGQGAKNDPLDDSCYHKIHRRLERQEKQLRNIEKERAMHEKVQLERLLDGLKGHDWLRVMGISGITDGEKKAYEPRRDHLIREVRVLLEKFKLWKQEEKRIRFEKDEANEEDDINDVEDESGKEETSPSSKVDKRTLADSSEAAMSDGDPPDYSDIDASAARQLHLEAIRAKQTRTSISSIASPPTRLRLLPPKSPSVLKQKPITSFFSKAYMRQAAIGNHRRGRSRYAFGQPLPEVEEHNFELPSEILTEDVLAASERSRRAAKRGKEVG